MPTSPAISNQEWEKLRKSFQTSIMIDTSLRSLAQNLEGPDWPLAGKDETPSKYIDMSLDELLDYFSLKGRPPEIIDQLAGILRETLAFDQPFGDMVEQVQAATERDDTLLRNLARLEIPESFPMDLSGLGADTREFCRLEKITTIGEFTSFAQGLSQNIIVGGDFRTLLNAIVQSDVTGLAAFLPLRPGSKGLHLPEAVAVLARVHPSGVRHALAMRAGLKLSVPAAQEAMLAPADKVAAAESDLRLKTSRLVSELFKDQLAQLRTQMEAGNSLERHCTSIGDPTLEAIVCAQLRPLLKPVQTSQPTKPRKAGFWARLFGRA